MVEDGALSHKIDYVPILGESKSRRASKSLLWVKSYGDFGEGGILPRGAVASGRVCVCSLQSRLFFVEGVFLLGCVCSFYICLRYPWPPRYFQGNVHLQE